jgi:hypothetical protein
VDIELFLWWVFIQQLLGHYKIVRVILSALNCSLNILLLGVTTSNKGFSANHKLFSFTQAGRNILLYTFNVRVSPPKLQLGTLLHLEIWNWKNPVICEVHWYLRNIRFALFREMLDKDQFGLIQQVLFFWTYLSILAQIEEQICGSLFLRESCIGRVTILFVSVLAIGFKLGWWVLWNWWRILN